jgi:hypothetical protein
LDLGKQQIAKEKEIQQLFKVLNDSKINDSLLSGRDFWVKLYNRKVKEYKSFCDKNTLKTSIFMKVIK